MYGNKAYEKDFTEKTNNFNFWKEYPVLKDKLKHIKVF